MLERKRVLQGFCRKSGLKDPRKKLTKWKYATTEENLVKKPEIRLKGPSWLCNNSK